MNIPEHLSDNPCLLAAIDYARKLGWYLVPCYGIDSDGSCTCRKRSCASPGKHPRLGKHWHKKASCDPEELILWWAAWPDSNIGLLLGERSGVIDVECDHPDAERLYAEICGDDPPAPPTYTSGRGRHRLFKWTQNLRQPAGAKAAGLDVLTGNSGKQITILPPSRHASGITREWILDPFDASLEYPPFGEKRTQYISRGGHIEGEEVVGAPVSHALGPPPAERDIIHDRLLDPDDQDRPEYVVSLDDEKVQIAILSTLPNRPGQRVDCLFQLIRKVKGLGDNDQLRDVDLLAPIVERWFSLALPFIKTKDYVTTWEDFVYRWSRCHTPIRDSLGLSQISARVETSKAPPIDSDDQDLQALNKLCYELSQESDDRTFPLGARKAGEFLGCGRTAAAKRLRTLVDAGVILPVSPGKFRSRGKCMATVYAYVEDQTA